MLFINEEAEIEWTNLLERSEGDVYSEATMMFAEKLASILEKEINTSRHINTPSETIAKTAEKALQNASEIFGITAFQYGWAIGALSKVWFYGKELRVWHNNRYDYDGDGVVNPAILTTAV